ncbi:hypothetical protein [Actinokineospora fastidiosa]|uniref:Uncharacterized protein n=1 Tax=Actinokineospora fastidiosa TaxID=1816 RepID=A0A918GDL4_9PSEU|nr:hypothetical protein [Actinokineospora fastidiosa]GGS30364.1 hypothetical protein GCM10010171_24870 [Actinokineospora fastidiosa]
MPVTLPEGDDLSASSFEQILFAVTGTGPDLRGQVNTGGAPGGQHTWFLFSDKPSAENSWHYRAWKTYYFGVDLNMAAFDNWRTMVEEINGVADQLFAGKLGTMDVQRLWDSAAVVEKYVSWLRTSSESVRTWTTSLSGEGSAFKGKAAYAIQVNLRRLAFTLEDLRSQIFLARRPPTPEGLRNAAQWLGLFGQNMANAWWKSNAFLLNGAANAARAIMANVRNYLSKRGLFLANKGEGGDPYYLDDGNPLGLSAEEWIAHVLQTYDSHSYAFVGGVQFPSGLTSVSGDLRQRATWDKFNAAISDYLRAELNKLDAVAQPMSTVLARSYEDAARSLRELVHNPPPNVGSPLPKGGGGGGGGMPPPPNLEDLLNDKKDKGGDGDGRFKLDPMGGGGGGPKGGPNGGGPELTSGSTIRMPDAMGGMSGPDGGSGPGGERFKVAPLPEGAARFPGQLIDPVTGNPIDPVTGRPIDPVTGRPIDPVTGRPVDPAGGMAPPLVVPPLGGSPGGRRIVDGVVEPKPPVPDVAPDPDDADGWSPDVVPPLKPVTDLPGFQPSGKGDANGGLGFGPGSSPGSGPGFDPEALGEGVGLGAGGTGSLGTDGLGTDGLGTDGLGADGQGTDRAWSDWSERVPGTGPDGPPTAPSAQGGANQLGGMPFFPPMMGGMGGPGGGSGNDRERERQTWLTEDEKVWGADRDGCPGVIGRPGGEGQQVDEPLAPTHVHVRSVAPRGRTAAARKGAEATESGTG